MKTQERLSRATHKTAGRVARALVTAFAAAAFVVGAQPAHGLDFSGVIAAIFGGVSDVTPWDTNGDAVVTAADLVAVEAPAPTATTEPGVTPTEAPEGTPTAVAPTNTPTQRPTRTPTRVRSATPGQGATATIAGIPTPTSPPPPTATATPAGAAVCGNGTKESGEECDDGGICTGGDNAGTACTAESQCVGSGVCVSGSKSAAACANDAACPDGKCVKCRPFGGDACAANCTLERTIAYTLKPGQLVKRCTAGANQSLACTVDAECPGSKCNFGGCLGGVNDGKPCTAGAECPGGRYISQVLDQTTTGAFIHDGVLHLALPIAGQQALTIGGMRDGMIPGVSKAAASSLLPIKVGSLACACTRSVAVKTCGGTTVNEDGSVATDCTPDFTAGDGVCAGKKPCAFVHGPGNAATAVIGCNGLAGTDLLFTQDAGMKPGELPPPAPTPQPNSKPPIITLSGNGGPGSAVVLNTSALGLTANGPSLADKCVDTTTPPHPDFGPDGRFCTDDDPQSARGTPATLPQVTGTATGIIFNTTSSTSASFNLGPYSYTGHPYDCAALMAPTPSLSGATVAGAFCALNQPSTGDIVVRNIFVVQ